MRTLCRYTFILYYFIIRDTFIFGAKQHFHETRQTSVRKLGKENHRKPGNKIHRNGRETQTHTSDVKKFRIRDYYDSDK